MPDSKSHIPMPTQASPARRVFHTLITLAGWALFVYWWSVVVHRVSRHEVRFTVLFVLVSLVICVALTGLWVLHNRSIFRRKGPRTAVREAVLDYSRDPLGRTVTFEASAEDLLRAPVVRVLIEYDRKQYHLVSPETRGRRGIPSPLPVSTPQRVTTKPQQRSG